MGNSFCHVELMTEDDKKAVEFYKKMFAWKFKKLSVDEETDYYVLDTGKEPGGGIMKLPAPDAPNTWNVYIQVADVAAHVKKAKKLGATVDVGKTEIPGFGWFAILTDPQGAVFGIWQPPEPPAKRKPKKAKKTTGKNESRPFQR